MISRRIDSSLISVVVRLNILAAASYPVWDDTPTEVLVETSLLIFIFLLSGVRGILVIGSRNILHTIISGS